METIDELALDEPCEYCGAKPGWWCTRKNGKRAIQLHSVRSEVLRAGWRVGYREAQYYTARNYLRAPERFEQWAREQVALSEAKS